MNMRNVLQWRETGEAVGLTGKEEELLRDASGEQKLDLDAGGSDDNEVAGVFAFHSVFSLTSMPEGDFVLLDFGIIRNIRKIRLWLNGMEIGTTNSRQTEAAFVIPGSWLSVNNSLLAIVVDGSASPIWVKGVGRTDYLPDGYQGELEELPSEITIHTMRHTLTQGELRLEGNELQISADGDAKKISLTFWKGDIVRVRVQETDKTYLVNEICLEQMEENLEPLEPLVVEERGDEISIQLDHHNLVVRRDLFQIQFYDVAGKLLLSHLPQPMNSNRCCGLAIALKEQEHIFGLGENATPTMDKRGQTEDIWVSHDWIHCDIPVPYYISTEGYGFYLNNSYHSYFDMGRMDSQKAVIWALGGEVDYFFLPGPEPKQIAANYSRITGLAKLPPRWAFGFFQSKTGEDSTDMIQTKMDRFQILEIPLDVISIDPDWQNDYCDWQWNQAAFPSEEAFIQLLEQRRMRLMLWSSPFVKKNCRNFADGVEKGMFLRQDDGRTLPVLWWKDFDSGIVDFMNPEAVKWWMEQCRPFMKAGVDVFKIDGGDGGEVPADARNVDGAYGSEFHNLFPLYFAKAFYEELQEVRPGKRVMVWERTGFAGSGRYPCTWGGDQPADFTGTEVLMKGGQQAGMCGIYYWAPDVGGFAKNSGTSEEFFIRSYQWGALAPMSRGHGNQTEPYAFGERALEIVRAYIQLRYRLLPYLYSSAFAAMVNRVPMMRAMVMEYPLDVNCYSAQYQYFMGDQIMLAPVHEQGDPICMAATESIYLPKGDFIDYWTEVEYEGGQYLEYEAKLDILPMFVKKGAIIPMLSQIYSTEEYTGEAYELHIYPSKEESQFHLYYDDGITLDYEQGIFDEILISAVEEEGLVRVCFETLNDRMPGRSIDFQIIVHGMERKSELTYQKGVRTEILL